MNIKGVPLYLSYLFLSIFWTACEVPEEGCLDPIAKNFEAAADKDCCCEYYQLELGMTHRYDMLDFSLNTKYIDQALDSFWVNDFNFYISNLELKNDKGDWINVDNNTTLTTLLTNGDEETQTIPDNFTFIKSNTLIASIGDFTKLDTFNEVRFTIGLTPIANHADPTGFSNSHALSDDTGTHITRTEGYNFLSTSVSYIGTDTLTETLMIAGDGNETAITLPFTEPLVSLDGESTRISVKVDYKLFFEGISFKNDTETEKLNKLKTNVQNAFSIL